MAYINVSSDSERVSTTGVTVKVAVVSDPEKVTDVSKGLPPKSKAVHS